MPQPTEHKSVQARILKYAYQIGWTFVKKMLRKVIKYTILLNNMPPKPMLVLPVSSNWGAFSFI